MKCLRSSERRQKKSQKTLCTKLKDHIHPSSMSAFPFSSSRHCRTLPGNLCLNHIILQACCFCLQMHCSSRSTSVPSFRSCPASCLEKRSPAAGSHLAPCFAKQVPTGRSGKHWLSAWFELVILLISKRKKLKFGRTQRFGA